jgi:cytochrome c-type biogenesis protein
MIHDVTLYMAFAAGLISFLSPCVLPIVPGYISFISGVSLEDIKRENGSTSFMAKERRSVLINSMFFIAGFSVVFVLLGASATWAGSYLSSKISILTKIAGLVIIFFGIFKMGLIRSLFFYRQVKFHLKDKKFGLAGALLIGASFGFGWTPCIGPILGGVLAYAGTLDKVNQGIILLLIYSMGMGIPFILAALAVNQFLRFFDRMKKHMGLLETISGIVMVILGLMIFTNKLVVIPRYLSFLNRFAL